MATGNAIVLSVRGLTKTYRSAGEDVLVEAARLCKATVISSEFHQFQPHGVSGVVIISESHLAIHTWPERGYAAGFHRLGIGALFGLGDWRREALCVAAHALYLLRHCWKAALTISTTRSATTAIIQTKGVWLRVADLLRRPQPPAQSRPIRNSNEHEITT